MEKWSDEGPEARGWSFGIAVDDGFWEYLDD